MNTEMNLCMVKVDTELQDDELLHMACKNLQNLVGEPINAVTKDKMRYYLDLIREAGYVAIMVDNIETVTGLRKALEQLEQNGFGDDRVLFGYDSNICFTGPTDKIKIDNNRVKFMERGMFE